MNNFVANNLHIIPPQFEAESLLKRRDLPETPGTRLKRNLCGLACTVINTKIFADMTLHLFRSAPYGSLTADYVLPGLVTFSCLTANANVILIAYRVADVFRSAKQFFRSIPKQEIDFTGSLVLDVILFGTSCLTAVALAALGFPGYAAVSFASIVASNTFWAYLTPKTPQTVHTKLPSLSGHSDEEILKKLKSLTPLLPGQATEIDLSFSKITDHTLNLLAGHLFSKRKYPIGCILNLEGCSEITAKGLERLLSNHSHLHVILTQTNIEHEALYKLQTKFALTAHLNFQHVWRDLSQFFKDEVATDIVFQVGSEKIPAHRFIYAAFDQPIPPTVSDPDAHPIIVSGISATELRMALKEAYSGRLSPTTLQKLSAAQTADSLFSKPYNPYFVNNIWKNHEKTDCTIETKDGTCHAHKAILIARSRTWKDMLTGELQIEESNISLPQWTKAELDVFLEAIYTGKIPESPFFPVRSFLEFCHRYEILDLKLKCENKLLEETTRGTILDQPLAWLEYARNFDLGYLAEIIEYLLLQEHGLATDYQNPALKVTIHNLERDPFKWIKKHLPNVHYIEFHDPAISDFDDKAWKGFQKELDLNLQHLPQCKTLSAAENVCIPKSLWMRQDFRWVSLTVNINDDRELSYLIQSQPQLESLVLNNYSSLGNLTDKSIKQLVHLKNLKHLTYRREGISPGALKELPQKLESVKIAYKANNTFQAPDHLCQLRGLKALSLENCVWLSSSDFLPIIQNNPHLSQINFNSKNLITNKVVKAIAENLPVESLNLSQNRLLTKKSLTALAQNCKQLSSLSLDECPSLFDANALHTLLTSIPTLQHLSLQTKTLHEGDISTIFADLSALTSLNLIGWKLSLNDLKYILAQCPCLRTLHLSAGCVKRLDFAEIQKSYPPHLYNFCLLHADPV